MRTNNRTGSLRVHPSHSLSLAAWRSPSRSTTSSQTGQTVKDALELIFLKTQHGASPTLRSRQITNNQTNPEPCKPTSDLRSHSLTLCETPGPKPADSLCRRLLLRDSLQRPQRSGRLRSTRRPRHLVFFLTTSSRKNRLCQLQCPLPWFVRWRLLPARPCRSDSLERS
jgi:hypothetical protein